jgi:DNA helicase II / ATP-dependent DNA helicase PcrA
MKTARDNYQQAFASLNAAQRKAVTTTEGPVLVIAGPGTGKTQLLTTRAAHILQTTDAQAHNILCLTFTDSAAHNMRERLSGLIGGEAHKVHIGTYHSFGSDLIRRFPDFFTDFAEREPVDDLDTDQIIRQILAALAYDNPLASDIYLRDIKQIISEAKQGNLSPEDLRSVAEVNLSFIEKTSSLAGQIFGGMARLSAKDAGRFEKFAQEVAPLAQNDGSVIGVLPLEAHMLNDLRISLEVFATNGKTPSLREWKDKWLAKNADGNFVVEGERTNRKLIAAANIYAQYQKLLASQNKYDYDDMIIQAVHTLEKNAELRYNLQEQYLYLMLDEFQDTNGVQMRLVELLTDNPVHEGRPNVLAVGDDDQAIYAFQGADHSHMLRFAEIYRDVATIPLTENYRSHPDILHTAEAISSQIEQRLTHSIDHIDKTLKASNTKLPKQAVVERREATSDVAMYAWVASQIKQLVNNGMPAHDIAVLAPRHKHLEPLVAFLHQQKLNVSYEKRENVLDNPAIQQITTMSELVIALANNDQNKASHLWPQVLSYDFWQLPTKNLWQLSWEINDQRSDWTNALLEDETLQPVALFFIRLSQISNAESCETMIDALIGTSPLQIEVDNTYVSPFYDYYFGASSQQENLGDFWQVLSNLTVLRERLRAHLRGTDHPTLHNYIDFINAMRASKLKIINTNPHQEASDAIQIKTAFKAKGEEFNAVFMLSVQDDAWGRKARSQSAKIALPANLRFIRHAGADDDERLRLLFVAMTRARSQLYMVSHDSDYGGKAHPRLAYLNEHGDESPLLPAAMQKILPVDDGKAGQIEPNTSSLSAFWSQRHTDNLDESSLRELLADRLQRYQLSPTHVGSFTDIERQGPQYFLLNTLLRFPSAPIPAGAFGNAIHETLQWIHQQNKSSGQLPQTATINKIFAKRLASQGLNPEQTEHYLQRGQNALLAYLNQRQDSFKPTNQHEYNFRSEGVTLGEVRLGGKIDKLVIDPEQKTIEIVDFKTGKPSQKWYSDTKLHRYRQQLYLYKALVEGSNTFKDYRVTAAYLEFVEPDEQGNINILHLDFNAEEEKHIQALAKAIWQQIHSLDIPDISNYPATLAGIKQFEQDLIAKITT